MRDTVFVVLTVIEKESIPYYRIKLFEHLEDTNDEVLRQVEAFEKSVNINDYFVDNDTEEEVQCCSRVYDYKAYKENLDSDGIDSIRIEIYEDEVK